MNSSSIEPGELGFKIDGHADMLFEMRESHADVPFDQLEDIPVSLDKLKAAGVVVTVAALYCPDAYNGAESAAYLTGLISYAEKYLTGLKHIRSAGEFGECIEKKTPGSLWLLENADALLDFDLSRLVEAGVRVAGLTHVGRNRIGDGNGVPFPTGLTEKGKDLVRGLSGDGFAFDAAHLAGPGFLDLIRIHEGPILSSHTGVRSLNDSPRNLTREQIGLILERKGVIGIAADPKILSPSGKASIEDIFRHIDSVAQWFEADGIGIGTDFCGFETTNAGFEDVTRLDDLARIMLAHGYPVESIRKIMGGNWRVFYETLLG